MNSEWTNRKGCGSSHIQPPSPLATLPQESHPRPPRHPQPAPSRWKQIGQLLLLGKQPLGLIRDAKAVMPNSRCYCGRHMG